MHRASAFPVLFLVLFQIPDPSVAGEQQRRSPRYEISMGIRQSPMFTFSHFPVAFRSVPLHPNDGYLADNPIATEPLRDTTLVLHRPLGVDFSFRCLPNDYIALGVVVSAHTDNDPQFQKNQRYRQNQWGTSERGYGASLRWYQLSSGVFSQAGLSLGLQSGWLRIVRTTYVRVQCVGIYDLTGLKIETQTGYDRWNSDEKWKSFTIGHLFEHRVLLGAEIATPMKKEKPDGAKLFFGLAYLQPFSRFYLSYAAAGMIHSKESDPRITGYIGVSF